MTKDILKILPDMDAGIFAAKLSAALSEIGLAVAEYGKEGRMNIEIKVDRAGESNQLMFKHALKYVRPTRRGKTSEEDVTQTAFYVNGKGEFSVMPTNEDLFTPRSELA